MSRRRGPELETALNAAILQCSKSTLSEKNYLFTSQKNLWFVQSNSQLAFFHYSKYITHFSSVGPRMNFATSAALAWTYR